MSKIILEDMEYIFLQNVDWQLLRDKTVLVTGASGMLPSYVVYFLIYLNEFHNFNITIKIVVRNFNKVDEKFGFCRSRKYIDFIVADVCSVCDLQGDLHYLIHGASPASPQFYGVDPLGVSMPNILGTYNMLQMAYDKQCLGVLYFSSCEVYGKVSQSVVSEDDMGVLDPMDLRNCYAESKRMGESLCKSFSHQQNVAVKVVRLAHTYGPTMDVWNDKRVFAEFAGNIVRNENIVMKSSGAARRSFCYVADAVSGFFKILFQGKSGEAYNLANTAETYSVKELAENLASLYAEEGIKVITQKRNDNDEYMESVCPNFPTFNCDKLEKLGWAASYDIRVGFQRSIEFIREKKIYEETYKRPYPYL